MTTTLECILELFYLLYFGIPPVLIFQLEVYSKVYLLNKKEQLLDGIQIKHLYLQEIMTSTLGSETSIQYQETRTKTSIKSLNP